MPTALLTITQAQSAFNDMLAFNPGTVIQFEENRKHTMRVVFGEEGAVTVTGKTQATEHHDSLVAFADAYGL